eukprot:snap_masked-scaffold_24-processed-gene-0.42-mRNA-1 protein AED:1.00 eAED:1.00 QI:0/0/0/0/1/1/3/0/62
MAFSSLLLCVSSRYSWNTFTRIFNFHGNGALRLPTFPYYYFPYLKASWISFFVISYFGFVFS